MADDILAFPEGFLWGTATASHQVEGGNTNNDWWVWEQMPGRIADGSRSGAACDWWQRAEHDLTLAASLGQNAHRLSLEWSRLEPAEGRWDEEAVERYRRMLGHMRGHGLEPMVTLHHFTLPLWLAERGGWENPRAVDWFARYAARCAEALGDLVTLWCTINEPMVYLSFGYVYGAWPPGAVSLRAAARAFAHLARAHAAAYAAIHRRQAGAQVGLAKHYRVFAPLRPNSRRDRLAAALTDRLFNQSVAEAFCRGRLPRPLGRGQRIAEAPIADWIGLNYYTRDLVTLSLRGGEGPIRRQEGTALPWRVPGWGELYAEGLERGLRRWAAEGLPLYVTEFGVPEAAADDCLRQWCLASHVAAMHRALRAGVDLRGAFHWTLVDNWEWAEGWTLRFGLVALDPETQARTPRASAGLYARIARANGLERAVAQQAAGEEAAAWFA